MVALALDTSGKFCSACVYDHAHGKTLATIAEDIGRGHAERLMDTISHCMAKADVSYDDLKRIIVSTGPGSFTGIRVGVATARGFALGLDIPVTGVTVFETLMDGYDDKTPAIAIMSAGRNQVYCQCNFTSSFANADEPFLASLDDLKKSGVLKTRGLVLCKGSEADAAQQLGMAADDLYFHPSEQIKKLARIGCAKPHDGKRPEPLYLRKPDAKPQQGFAVERSGS